MKYMKYVDWAAQTLVLALTTGGAIIIIFIDEKPGAWGVLLYGQLFLGPWQFFSSLISSMARSAFHRKKRWHLLISVAYLLILFTGAKTNAFGFNIPEWANIFFLMVPAWCLGIYYYSITWRWAFQSKSPGRFLSHISF